MSKSDTIAEHCVSITVAALGLAGTAAAGPISLAVLAAIGFQTLRANRKACQTALTKVLEQIGKTDPGTVDEVAGILAHSDMTVSLAPGDLPPPANKETLNQTYTDTLMRMVPHSASMNAQSVIRIMFQHAVEACRYSPELHPKIMQELVWQLHGQTAEVRAMLVEIVTKLTENTGREDRLADRLIINLAKRIAPKVPDREAALRELEHAVDVAQAVQRRGTTPSNHPDFVDAVFAEVAKLADEGDLDAGAAALEDALAANKAAEAKIRDAQIDQHTLRRDAPATAAAHLGRLRLDHAEPDAWYDALWTLRSETYRQGGKTALPFTLELAIALADLCITHAPTPERKAGAQNNLGIALATLGVREEGTDRLEAAVTAYEGALEVHTRADMPIDWAMTQNNLGNALATLGTREEGTDRLEAAVTAYTNALEVRTRADMPIDWAMIQNNLGTALADLGAREEGTERLEAAVTAYTKALEVYTRADMPLQWATTQNNLGNALRDLGAREEGTDRLEAAVTAYEGALEVRTRADMPLQWAMTKNNLGAALQTLGAREEGTDRLEAAVTAYEGALEVRTHADMPLQWAMTQENIAIARLNLFKRTQDPTHLHTALASVTGALEVYTAAGADFNINTATRLRGLIQSRMDAAHS